MSSHYVHDNSIAPNIVQAHTFYGSPVTATMRPDSHGSNIAPAVWSTAPYKPPSRRERDNGKELCAFEECRAYPSAKAGGAYCIGHARKLGLVPTCAQARCNASPMADGGGFCFHHQPKVVTEEVPVDGNTE